MKPAALTGTLLLLTATASAQLSLLPQVGFENTNIAFNNNGGAFTSLPAQASFKAALRMDYRFKKGHGPFAGISTAPAAVAIDFADPARVINQYKTSMDGLQWRLEGGYQYSSKPIYFKKGGGKDVTKTTVQKEVYKSSCGNRTYYTCRTKSTTTTIKNKDLNMRLQPYAGVAYIPSVAASAKSMGNQYQYLAGNWNTAFISGIGFEFGKGSQRLFTLSAHYTKGMGNLQTTQFVREENGKATTAALDSKASSWGLTFGVPMSLTKAKKATIKQPSVTPATKTLYKKQCGSYRTVRHI